MSTKDEKSEPRFYLITFIPENVIFIYFSWYLKKIDCIKCWRYDYLYGLLIYYAYFFNITLVYSKFCTK